MNVRVHRAVSDMEGKTGMAIMRAIVSGERNAQDPDKSVEAFKRNYWVILRLLATQPPSSRSVLPPRA
jgi:hypothetical protein